MTDTEIDYILEDFDRTRPALQRHIVARCMHNQVRLRAGLAELVALVETQAETSRLRGRLGAVLAAARELLAETQAQGVPT